MQNITTTNNNPSDLGYRMPAEWEKQDAVWLSWPHNKSTFEEFLPDVQAKFIEFMRALHTGQIINILVNDLETQNDIIARCKNMKIKSSQIHFHIIKNEDVWFRDYGPTFVIKPKGPSALAMIKWTFTAWGNKYDDLKLDNHIPFDMNKILNIPMFEPGIVLEGGSIDVNGQGALLTTEQCLLNHNRNPQLTKEKIEGYLKQNLGVSKVLWLKDGIVGDDTDGHIDDIARFVNRNTVICAYDDDAHDENFPILNENLHRLLKMSDQQNSPLNIIKVPMPGIVEFDGKRMPASYLNFYVGNQVVVVPTFNHINDKKALKTIQDSFPYKKVVGIDCSKWVFGLGTLHCSSQQQPSTL